MLERSGLKLRGVLVGAIGASTIADLRFVLGFEAKQQQLHMQQIRQADNAINTTTTETMIMII